MKIIKLVTLIFHFQAVVIQAENGPEERQKVLAGSFTKGQTTEYERILTSWKATSGSNNSTTGSDSSTSGSNFGLNGTTPSVGVNQSETTSTSNSSGNSIGREGMYEWVQKSSIPNGHGNNAIADFVIAISTHIGWLFNSWIIAPPAETSKGKTIITRGPYTDPSGTKFQYIEETELFEWNIAWKEVRK